jgi:carboxypeptidase family protein
MKRGLLVLAAMVLCFSSLTWAQDTANITGTVTDSTGAVIPNAKITVSNPDVAYTRETVSDTAGLYSVSRVPIGNYVITCEAAGFQKLVRSGIALSVGQIQRVDLQMTVGQVTQEVTVTGNVPQVETETAAISDVVTGGQIANLELNGRNFVTLALLVPGASPDNGLDTMHVGVYGNNSISFNGSRTQYNNWEIDGGNNTDEGSAGTFNTYPNLDTIAEFRISTSNYGADMGKHAGATIEVATKAGTRDFHGDAFEYVRNDVFDANPWEINRTTLGARPARTPLKWNDYGYTLGGPFYIPGHYNTDKSKTFFYWSEDWRKYRDGQVVSAGVPTLRQRAGDFSECNKAIPFKGQADVCSGFTVPASIAANGYQINSSLSGYNAQDFTNGTDLLNGLVPLPNTGPAGHLDGWTLSSSTATNWRQEQIRVDQNVSDKTTVFVRYTHDAWDTVAVPSLWAWASFDTIKTPFAGPGTTAVLHITHSFKPNLMNEFVMGWTQDHIALQNQAGTSCVNGPCQINRTGFSGANAFVLNHFFPANVGNPLLPGFALCGGAGSSCFSEDASNHPWFNSNPIVTVKDNIAWTHSNHTLRFGAFLEDYRKNEQFGADTQGYLQYANWGSNTSGNALADLFLGRMAVYTEGTETFAGIPVGGYPKGHWHQHDIEPYFQDDWKVNSHLTLNLGLRYYYLTRIHDVSKPTVDSGFLPNLYNPANEAKYNSSGTLIQGSGAIYTAFGNGLVQCGANGIPNGCQLNNDGKNWAPRFGFAWDPWGNGKTVVRGGYGIYYEMGNGNEAQAEGGEGNPPVALSPSVFNVTGSSNILPVFNSSTGQYSAPLGPTGYTAWPYSQPWGSEQQFSLGMQHQFSGSNLVSVGYVGMLGRHLARSRSLTQVPLGLGTVNVPALAAPNNPADCDAAGNCNVQQVLMNQEASNIFFQLYPGYSGISMKENTAVSSYNALQLNFRHTFGHGLTFQTVYTWAKTMDDSTSTYNSSPNGYDDYHLSRWKALSDLNRTQVLTFNYIYDLPFFKNSGNRFARQGLGGWQISGISSFYTGEPINIGCGISGFSTGIGASVRCNSVGNLKIKKGTFNDPTYGPTPTWFDGSTFTQPLQSQLLANNEPGMFGYMGRNALTGPGRNVTDLALLKNFKLPWREGTTLQFRWETFNTFNHPQLIGVSAGCDGTANTDGSPAFGRPCNDMVVNGTRFNAGNGQVTTTPNQSQRIMQLGMKVIF